LKDFLSGLSLRELDGLNELFKIKYLTFESNLENKIAFDKK
jgi:hypothetical protein